MLKIKKLKYQNKGYNEFVFLLQNVLKYTIICKEKRIGGYKPKY